MKRTILAIVAVLFILGCQTPPAEDENTGVNVYTEYEVEDVQEDVGKYCTKEGTEISMSLIEAKEIAMNSECNQGVLSDDSSCNSVTGTWWIDLYLEKEGCSPACVINVETKQAEINLRCTGIIA